MWFGMGKFSRILVTGGAGFIGSNLVSRLMKEGYWVIVLDNFQSGRVENVSRYLHADNFKLVRGDVRDRDVVREAMDNVDAVVHLAALIDVEESMKNPSEVLDVNINGTFNVLERATINNVKKFVFASSTAVYGEQNPLPLKEDYPIKPISPYAASKASAECYCRAFNYCYGVNTVILRYFNVYGPGQKHNFYGSVITKFLRNGFNSEPLIIYGDGEQTRDFVFVNDAVDATVLALESDNSTDEIFNVCTGKFTTVKKLAQIVKDLVGRDMHVVYDKPRKGDIKNNYGDPAKAEKILGFKAKTSLKDGLEKTVNACALLQK